MKGIIISSDKKSVSPAEAAALYVELGWGTAREYSPRRMKRSIANCHIVVSARNVAGDLVGIARAFTDGAEYTKILDMVIAPEYQRNGVGRDLMRAIEKLAKGTTLYCETERKNFPFVEKLKYKKRQGLTVFVKKL
ncbi:MAG: GNAT family N-acetyltransferase [Patescibacteria group bacterium]|nr:GNAT family N-acetyltransferase [Patescibacteria group bacterium]